MTGVVLTGCSGALGRRVAAALVASPVFDRVVGLDLAPSGLDHGPTFHEVALDLVTDDLEPHFRGAQVVVHLASVFAPAEAGSDDARDVELTRRVVAAARAVGAAHLVVMSSATVYGAWPDNPIPLTELAALRPNPGFSFAHDKVHIERQADELAAGGGATVTVLRPTTTLAEDADSWVSSALRSAAGVRAGDVDPPVQFLHFDDLASATVLAAEQRLVGAYNVAPDGWIPPDAMRALAGVPRPRVPVKVADGLAAVRWRLGLTSTPPEILPWTMYPWVVANDRLRAAGWTPTHTNEEAFVVGTEPGPLATLSPKRRQELAIGAAGAVVVSAGVAAALAVRRLRRR